MQENLMMKGNKDPNYELKVTEAGSYHVEFTKTMRPVGKAFKGQERSLQQIFSIRDFKSIIEVAEGTDRRAAVGFLPLGWHEMRILHDPIKWNAEQKEAEEQADRQAVLDAKKLAADKAESEAVKEKPKGRPKKV